MSAIILFMAGIAAIAGWWLSQQRLGAKPWLEEGVIVDFREESAPSLPPAKIGLGVFLAVVGSLFALFISAYSMRMSIADRLADAFEDGEQPAPIRNRFAAILHDGFERAALDQLGLHLHGTFIRDDLVVIALHTKRRNLNGL